MNARNALHVENALDRDLPPIDPLIDGLRCHADPLRETDLPTDRTARPLDCCIHGALVKHCFRLGVKHCLIPLTPQSVENQVMLDQPPNAREGRAGKGKGNPALAELIRNAMDGATPPVTPARAASELSVSPQAVTGWRKFGRIGKDKLGPLAKLCGKHPAYFLGEPAPEASADSMEPLSAREEIMLLLFRGLFMLQQRELIDETRALFDANQVTRKELGQAELRGVSNEQIEIAFKIIPGQPPSAPPAKPKHRSSPGRPPGAELDDYRE